MKIGDEMKGGSMRRIVFLMAVMLIGCAPTANLNRLQLGMSKAEAQRAMGDNGTTRGAMTEKDGSRVEILEYVLDNPYKGTETYWLRFVNGELNRWGLAGDWEPAADQKIDITHQ